MKVLVDFPACFESDRHIPIQLGRIMIGHHVGRLYFEADGKMRLLVPEAALQDGSIVVMGDHGAELLGFTVNRTDKT